MALIKCPECGNDVSTFAQQCPHCGHVLIQKSHSSKYNKENRKYAIIGCILFIIGFAFQFIAKEIYKNCRAVYADYVVCMSIAPAMKYGGMGMSIGSIGGPCGSFICGGIGAIGGGIYGCYSSNDVRRRSQLYYDKAVYLSTEEFSHGEVTEIYDYVMNGKRSTNGYLRLKLTKKEELIWLCPELKDF